MGIEFIDQLIAEVTTMDLKNFIFVALLFYVPFYFSKKAQSLFFRLLYSYFGIYMLATMEDVRVIYDVKMLVGLGLLVPQISFIIKFVKDTIQTVKMMSANTYYFFVTLYYKIVRFFNWLKSVYIMFKSFFTSFGYKQKNYRSEEQGSKREKSYERKQERFYEESESRQKSYQEEQSYTRQEEPEKEVYREYERFYSDSAYVVLGVNGDDDFKTIKKAYRTLIREYHPDLNPNNIEQYTEITQLINAAYEKLENWHK